MEHHSRQIKATVGVQIVAVPEFFHLSEERSDGVQDGEAVGLDVRVVPLERVSERSAVSGLQRHSPNNEHPPSLEVPTLQVCRDGGPGGGLQDFLPVQGSEAVFGGRVPGGRPRGLVPGQSSTASSCGARPVEQVTDVPFGMSQDSIPQRAVLRAPQVAEQLVEVPVLVPFFNDWFRWEEAYRATGNRWLGGFEWSCSLTGNPPPVQGGFQILGKVLVDVTGIVQLQFQQSKPNKQFFDRGVDIPGFGWYARCKLCRGSVVRRILGTVLAQCLARQRIHVLPISVVLLRYFPREGGLGS